MSRKPPHARAFDIPGWPCPPRVRDIQTHPGSWGALSVTAVGDGTAIAQDDLGYRWVNGDIVPQFKRVGGGSGAQAVAFWTEAGIGLWICPDYLSWLASISKLDMKPDQWLPVSQVVADPPAFATKA
jgi:hypothetical protein